MPKVSGLARPQNPPDGYRRNSNFSISSNGIGMTTLPISIRPIVALIALTASTILGQSSDSAGSSANTPNPILQTRPDFTAQERFRWIGKSTVGPKNLAAGLFVAGLQTWRNKPETWGPHWEGYGKRYGARLVGGVTANGIEAGFGSLWGEDPRYYRASGQPFKARVGHVVKSAFVTHNRNGDPQLAFARYIAVPGGILISNTWRPDSPSTVGHVSSQIGVAFGSRIIGNAFSEFFPDIRSRLKRNPRAGSRNNPLGATEAGDKKLTQLRRATEPASIAHEIEKHLPAE